MNIINNLIGGYFKNYSSAQSFEENVSKNLKYKNLEIAIKKNDVNITNILDKINEDIKNDDSNVDNFCIAVSKIIDDSNSVETLTKTIKFFPELVNILSKKLSEKKIQRLKNLSKR